MKSFLDISNFLEVVSAAAAAKYPQSCLTLCDPIDGSPPGSSIPGTLQARILERVAISFSNACMHGKSLQSCRTLCDPIDGSPPGSSVHRFSKQEYWSGLPFPSPKKNSMLSLMLCSHNLEILNNFEQRTSHLGIRFPSNYVASPEHITWSLDAEFFVSFFCCCSSVAQSCLTLCNPVDCSMPGFSVLHYLLKFAQTYVH